MSDWSHQTIGVRFMVMTTHPLVHGYWVAMRQLLLLVPYNLCRLHFIPTTLKGFALILPATSASGRRVRLHACILIRLIPIPHLPLKDTTTERAETSYRLVAHECRFLPYRTSPRVIT